MVSATDFTLTVPRARTTASVGVPNYEMTMLVMGTKAHIVIVHGDPALLDEARDRLKELHGKWTRFEPTSEVSRLNAAGGEPFLVSPETLLLVGLAVASYERTDGRFDPSVLPALEAAGYDRDIAEVISRAAPASAALRIAATPGCAGIEIDEQASTVCLPRGTSLDFGGIAKGVAADMIVTDLLDGGAIGACVNVGGDLRASGVAPQRGGWLIGLDHPRREHGSRNVGCLRLAEGAVATSSRMRRRWATGHHLIDPSSGQPADSGLQSVSVVADQAWQAEVLATAAFLAGPHDAPDLLVDNGAHGLLVLDDGSIRTTPGWSELVA